LFGNLESHGLGALGIERPEVYVDESPGMPLGNLGAQSIDVVVVSADRDHARSVDLRCRDLAALETFRDQDVRGNAGGCGLRRNRVRQVSRRRASDSFELEFEGLVDSHGGHAILEGQRGIRDAIVL
jgi:hypothetical protein